MSNSVIIDRLTIRIPNGWQGDPVLLARKASEQIQNQAVGLQSRNKISLSLQGHFAGIENSVAEQLGQQLSKRHQTGGHQTNEYQKDAFGRAGK